MNYPSAIARPLVKARLMLEESGAVVAGVTHTAPPAGPPAGPLRVVRERFTPEGVELVVAASVAAPEEHDLHL